MLAALLSLGIFAYCALVGLGLILVLRTEPKSYLPLLAPILGAAALIIPTVWLSQLGLPVGRFGPVLLAIFFLGAIVAIVRARNRIALAPYWPFAAILLLGFGFAAWPLFEFGFNWLSYSNDDMANYVLNAERLLAHGFYAIPAHDYFNYNKDPTLVYWINEAINNDRYGAEMLIALASSVTGLNGFQIYMPIMTALGLMQIAAAAALTYRSERYRYAAMVAAFLLAISALATFGIEYQLIAQLAGLPLLAAAIILICDVPMTHRAGCIALGGIITAALAMVYPETLPFLIIGTALYFALQLYRRAIPLRASGIWLGWVCFATLMFLNSYLRNSLAVLDSRFIGSAVPEATKYFALSFPFYLVPSGVANLFGLYSAAQDIGEPWLSLGIFLGLVLLAAAFVSAIGATRAGEPAGAPAVVMLALGLVLFWKQEGFGLYKLAMYVQPFVLPCLVLWWLRTSTTIARNVRVQQVIFSLPVLVFAALNLVTQQSYVNGSRAEAGQTAAAFAEIPNASASHLLDELAGLGPIAQRPSTRFVSDTFNIVFAKLESFFARPSAIIFPSDKYLRGNFEVPADRILQHLLIPPLAAKAIEISAQRDRHFRRANFVFTDDHGNRAFDEFFADTELPQMERHPQNVLFLANTAAQSVLNRWYNSDVQKNFEMLPLDRVRNHLVFIAGKYGLSYNSQSKVSSLLPLEPDLFYPDQTMAGIGRRLLLDVVNPTKRIRLEIAYTATLKDDGECLLHDLSVTGVGKETVPLVGRGSARVFLPAIVPRILAGQPYVLLDLGVNGTPFPSSRTGLMRLYGRDIPMDGRELVGFVRDVSALSEEEYQRRRPPSSLSDPPHDLLDRNLEYSGAYEDGWISEASQFVLSHPASSTTLAIRGVVPLIGDPNYHSMMRVLIGDREVGRNEVGVGNFNFQFPVRGVSERARVEVIFDRFQRLPNGDDRPVAAQLQFLGFQAAQQPSPFNTSQVDLGSGWYPLETYAGETFRWVDNDAHILTGKRVNEKSVLVLDVAPGPGVAGRVAALHLLDASGHELGVANLVERRIVRFNLKSSSGPQTYILHVEGGGTRIPSDPRILNFRVFSLRIAPS